MSVASYITELQERKQISYMQLAKEVGITYQNMIDLKNGKISFFSPKVLDKLSEYENKDKIDILYDSIDKEMYEQSSLCALKYLCKCILDGYSVTMKPSYPIVLSTFGVCFDGIISKKRIINNLTAVDSWETLKIEHMKQFRKMVYSQDAYSELFKTEIEYINNVVGYAISKVGLLNEENIKSYTIVVGKNVAYDIPYLESLIHNRSKIKINLVIEENR